MSAYIMPEVMASRLTFLEAARWLNKAQSQQTKNSNGGSLKSYHFASRDQDINVPY